MRIGIHTFTSGGNYWLSVRQMANFAVMKSKMHVDIWSDIMCPFCYIGKRHFEKALAQFENSNEVEIEWHSFQLDPNLPKPASELGVYEYLAQRKGITREQSIAMHANVVDMAKNAGLNYDFEKTVVANSFDAHRLIQFAKTKDLGDEAEERLFKAYFTEGRNMCDANTLLQLAKDIGLNEAEAKEVIIGDAYAREVKQDIQTASQIGVTGVPFFVFNRKYGVSGAQPASTFVNVLQRSFDEWKKEQGK
jgi:predicted DsbA family dithiol-disulfide isomerase